ncbi:MAG: hypothetical protein IKN05_01150, partial [Clostridia bacterium]|nr:hypothetical protein [Clostridia bacterium]
MAEQMSGKKPLFAYDIRLVVDGKVWQPEEYGTNVKLSMQDMNGDQMGRDIEIVHVKTDLMNADGTLSEEAVEKAMAGLDEGNVQAERIDTDTQSGAVSFGTGSFSGFMANTLVLLERMFKEAMDARKAGDKKVQIFLEGDTVYEGDATFSNVGYDVAEDFEVEFLTRDAGKDYLQSAGTTTVSGNINIKGINVTMVGVKMAAEKAVTVDNAKLKYYGTGDADSLAVNVLSKKGVANILTGAGDDDVTIDVKDGASAQVNTGEGDDTVTATVSDGSASISTEAGDDTVNATFSGDKSPVEMTIETGDGDDKVKVTNKANQGTTTVNTGDGNDNVEVDAHTGGMGGITVKTGNGDDTVSLTNTGSAPNPIGKLNVSLGAGDDMASVDMSLSTAVTDVTLRGGAGKDTAHFTGRLGDGTDEQKRVEGDLKNLKFMAASGKTLNVPLYTIEKLTDSLSNKETIELTPKDGMLAYEADRYFVDYKVMIPAKDIKDLKVTSKDGKYLPLSNLLINTATEVDGKNKLVISEGAIIDVRGLNVVLDGNNIEINGTIVAGDVNITANAGGKFVNVVADSKIVITDKAAIYTSGDVMILAKVTMAGPMLDANALVGAAVDLAPINSINVKIAHASVDIAGKVYAGLSAASLDAIAADPSKAKPAFGTDEGSVTAKAETGVSMGVDGDGKPLDSGWPVAVSVATVEATVNVQKDAVIEAAKDVSLGSRSTLKAGTRASSGLFGAPASAAVGVLINDVHTTVNGKLNAHSGDANVTAEGALEATTVADRGSGQKIISGGYAAVTVALQDVKAVLGSTAVVKAAGDVNVHSKATEKVVDKAASSSLKEESGGDDGGILGTIKEKVGDLLGTLAEKLINAITGKNKTEKKIKKALKLLPVSDKSVTLDTKAQRKGQVSADVVTENGKTKVKLNLEPWEGYEVKSITVRGYFPGESYWNVKTLKKEDIAGKNQVELDSVGNKMIVFVDYEEKQGQSEDDWTPADLFEEKDESQNSDDDELDEDTWRPSDLFNLDD